jgi:hypothetical protein
MSCGERERQGVVLRIVVLYILCTTVQTSPYHRPVLVPSRPAKGSIKCMAAQQTQLPLAVTSKGELLVPGSLRSLGLNLCCAISEIEPFLVLASPFSG